MLFSQKKTKDVFGMSNTILSDSYVDRGRLDNDLQRLLQRTTHVALRGESKCGKSWLRQKNLPDAIIVQCRLNKSVNDIYIDILSQLEIKLTIEQNEQQSFKGRIEASGSIGLALLGSRLITTI